MYPSSHSTVAGIGSSPLATPEFDKLKREWTCGCLKTPPKKTELLSVTLQILAPDGSSCVFLDNGSE